MIPKVATNLLHFTTARVAAAVQTGTQTITPTLRSALQSANAGASTSTGTVGFNAANTGLGTSAGNAAQAKGSAGGKFWSGYQHANFDPSFASSQQDDEDQQGRKKSFNTRPRRPVQPNKSLARRPISGQLVTSSRLAQQARFLQTRALERQREREVAAEEEDTSKAVIVSPKTSPRLARRYTTSATGATPPPEEEVRPASSAANVEPTSPTSSEIVLSEELLQQDLESFMDPQSPHSLDSLASSSYPSSSEGYEGEVDTDPSSPQSVLPPLPRSLKGRHPAMGRIIHLVRSSVHPLPSTTSTSTSTTPKRRPAQEKRQLQELIDVMKTDRVSDSVEWSCALWAVIRLRLPGESLRPAISLYNDLLSGTILPPTPKRQKWSPTKEEAVVGEVPVQAGEVIIPSERVVNLLIKALAMRDAEVAEEVRMLEMVEGNLRPVLKSTRASLTSSTSLKKIADLKKENNFAPAMALTHATLQGNAPRSLGVVVYNLLLEGALVHQRRIMAKGEEEGMNKKVGPEIGGVASAITIFAHLEKSGTRPSARTFGLLLQVYSSVNDLEGAKEVWNEFRSACARGSIDWILQDGMTPSNASVSDKPSVISTPWFKRAGQVSAETALSRSAVRSLVAVWSEMIGAHFECGDASGALAVLEKMMDAPLSISSSNSEGQALPPVPFITPVDVPPPAPETYYGVVRAFLNAGDVPTALAWFKRLLEQDPDVLRDGPKTPLRDTLSRAGGVKWDPTTKPPRPDRYLWDVVAATLFEQGKVEELNELMDFANSISARFLEEGVSKAIQEGGEKDIERVIRRVSKEDVATLDKRDGHHWALAWRANIAAMEAPGTPLETKKKCLDWLRTRIVDAAFFKPNHSTFAITEQTKVEGLKTPAYENISMDKAEENPDLFGRFAVSTTHRMRLTESVRQGLRDRAWHAVGMYISQGRIDEGIELAQLLFTKEHAEILENERRETSAQKKAQKKEVARALEGEVEVSEWTAGLGSGEKTLHALADLRSLVAGLEERIWTYGSETKQYPSLEGVLGLIRLTAAAGLMPAMRPAWYIVNAFLSHRQDPKFAAMVANPADWVLLAKTFSATAMSVFYEDNRPAPNPELAWQLVTFLQLMKENGKTWDNIGRNNVFRVYKILEHHLGQAELDKLLIELGGEFPEAQQYFPVHVKRSGVSEVKTATVAAPKEIDVAPIVDETRERFNTPRPTQPLNITPAQTSYVHEGVHSPFAHSGAGVVSPQVGFERLLAGYRIGDVPTPENIARLIVSLGHQRSKDKIVKCYEIGNEVLASLENNKSWQASGWFALEDAMVTALAHCGDMKAASLHRARLVAQGSAPSASAYGALIANIKDTTDNASVAIELFEESRRLNVEANAYLYNTIISRLAKARKADYAMHLFQGMKTAGLQPTEVTYGAVIAGCARIGDAVTAETLFEEMANLPGYKPRIPPFNTMMQLYTHVKPNRERALHYYELMQKMGVHPTPYTYKLMLDMYGKNEPVDVNKMDEIIKTMKQRGVEITGNHYSSLIVARGCTMQDLEGALQIFQDLRATPSTASNSLFPMGRSSQRQIKLPDVLAYEALLSVLVTHHRIDLMQIYFDQMIKKDKVRPTAYIYNLLIKGWASVGDLEAAREIFERMVDPAAGAAAPNNHAPHMGNEGLQMMSGSINGSPADPVYREPSSWEAMVRAELGAGQKNRANALLERMKTRYYPAAVTAKIENILWEPTQQFIRQAEIADDHIAR